MIKEVAIDPDLLKDPEKAIHLADQVGIHRARVLVSLPNKVWKGLFRDSDAAGAGLKWKRLSSYKAALQRLHRGAIKRAGVGPIGEMPWIEYAAVEHEREPLHAIVSEDEHDGAPVLDYDSIYEAASSWHAETTFEVRPTPRDMVSAVRLLLHQAQEVHMVDPYLDATTDYVRPLENILREMKRNGGEHLVWHAGERSYRGDGWGVHTWRKNTESDLRYSLKGLLGSELRFSVVLHDPKKLHDRFLLSERGGLSFGAGFAARKDGEPINVFLLSPDKAKKDLEKFRALSNGNIAFSVGGPAALHL